MYSGCKVLWDTKPTRRLSSMISAYAVLQGQLLGVLSGYHQSKFLTQWVVDMDSKNSAQLDREELDRDGEIIRTRVGSARSSTAAFSGS